MQKEIRKKWKSEQGTSIFFGLLLFLVVSILSVVMLNAAVSTIKSVESDKGAEQNYLTCSSAAKLLQKEIIDSKVIKIEKKISYTGTGVPSTETIWEVKSSAGTAVSSFGTVLKDSIQEFQQKNPAAEEVLKKTYKISVPSYTVEEDFAGDSFAATIEWELRPSESVDAYDILLRVSCGEKEDVCRIFVSLSGAIAKETTTAGGDGTNAQIVTTNTNTYSWTTKDIIYGTQERSTENAS